jgi:uncharacterized protein YndB with AHSA1/START domain
VRGNQPSEHVVFENIGKVEPKTVVMEPFVGGRWFEQGVDGSECDWGRVRIWDPPRRLVLSWEISSDWRHVPSIQTEIEARLTPTRVTACNPTSRRQTSLK